MNDARPETDMPADARAAKIHSCGTSQIGPRFLDAEAVAGLLSLADAETALSEGLRTRGSDELDGIPRTVLSMQRAGDAGGELLLMPAAGVEGAGVKLVTIVPSNAERQLPMIQGLYVLLTPDGLAPELVIDGAALTRLRTAAVTALATRHLARPDSRRLVVFGAGVQAEAHVEAMRTLLPIEHVTVVGRTPDSPSAARLAHALRERGVEAAAGTAATGAAADVICTCTTSTAPLFDAADLRDGVHINAIGAYRLDMCEIPAAAFTRAMLVVESVSATLAEAGDVVAAIAAGVFPDDHVAHELADLAAGRIGRDRGGDITIFKSVGLSVEDLIIARALADALPT